MAVLAALPLHAQDSSALLDEGKQLYMSVAGNLLKSADEMPAQDYHFRATPTSLTFADLIRKVSAYQEDACSAVTGTRDQADHVYPGDKTELTTMLRNSVHQCEAAFSSLNDFTASEQLTFGGTQYSKLGLLLLNVNHCSEVYGSMAIYLRLKGLVPPSSQAKLRPILGN